MIRIFAGYDLRTTIGYHVFCNSVHKRSSQPVSITPLMLSELSACFSRKRDRLQSTDFSFTRFLVPYLCDYEGWALFVDGADMLCMDDISKLWAQRDRHYAVQVVKNDHCAEAGVKFLGELQTPYERKNWSSVILFNNERCARLTPYAVHTQDGLWLHQFRWLEDAEIGSLDADWNFLVDVEAPREAKLYHYTIGLPSLMPCADSEAKRLWYNESEEFISELTR